MNVVRCLLFSLIAATITQQTYAMQQNQQPDTKMDQLEKNTTRIEQATKELEQRLERLEQLARIKIILQAPASPVLDEKILDYLMNAIFEKDFNSILYIARNIDSKRFRYIIHHIKILFQKDGVGIYTLSVYDIAKKKYPLVSNFIEECFPPLQ